MNRYNPKLNEGAWGFMPHENDHYLDVKDSIDDGEFTAEDVFTFVELMDKREQTPNKDLIPVYQRVSGYLSGDSNSKYIALGIWDQYNLKDKTDTAVKFASDLLEDHEWLKHYISDTEIKDFLTYVISKKKAPKKDESMRTIDELKGLVETEIEDMYECSLEETLGIIEEHLEFRSLGVLGDMFSLEINGHKYVYKPLDGSGLTANDLERKFGKMAQFSKGKALAWLKKNTVLHAGSVKGVSPIMRDLDKIAASNEGVIKLDSIDQFFDWLVDHEYKGGKLTDKLILNVAGDLYQSPIDVLRSSKVKAA